VFEGNVCFFYGSVFISDRKTESSNYPDLLLANDAEIAEEDKELLDIYHHSFSDDNIDADLLMTLLHEVHSSQDKGKSN
jgi:hypothetical protein